MSCPGSLNCHISLSLSARKTPVSDQSCSVSLGRVGEKAGEGRGRLSHDKSLRSPTWIQEGRGERLEAGSKAGSRGGSGRRQGQGASLGSHSLLHPIYCTSTKCQVLCQAMKARHVIISTSSETNLDFFMQQVFVVHLLCASIC